jgi:hypothetical protein
VSIIAGIGYTSVYAIGLSLMLTIIAIGGRSIISRFRGIADERGWFKKILGGIFLIVGFAIITGFDKKLETIVIAKFDISHVEESIIDRFLTKDTIPLASSSPHSQTVDPVGIQKIPTNMTQTIELNVANPYTAPEIALTNWINSDPLTMNSLRGKVVIIDFWTYSCINCQRTLPYLVDWDKKYRDK